MKTPPLGNAMPHPSKSRVVVKYREDQPRDASGRWTEDAAAGGDYTPDQRGELRRLASDTAHLQATGAIPKGVRADAKLTGEPVPPEELQSFVAMLAGNYAPDKSVAAFLLKNGKAFEVPAAPPPITLMKAKMCYENSTKQSTVFGGDYDYAEGYVFPSGLVPLQHAWNVDRKTGTVVDFTMGWMPKAAYYGVTVPEQRLRHELSTSGVYGAFEKDWRPSALVRNWGKPV